MARERERFEASYLPVPECGCWLWVGGVDRYGYGKAWAFGKGMSAHRMSWLLHRGPIPVGMCVCHTCDIPSCVNPLHLWIGTNAENDADKRRKGRQFAQPIHRETALTDDDVRAIRAARGTVRIVDLAKQYNLHYSQISRIQRGLYHAHIA